jgi:hypothetical protein
MSNSNQKDSKREKRPRSDSEEEDDVTQPPRKSQNLSPGTFDSGIPSGSQPTLQAPIFEDYGRQIDVAVNAAVLAATTFGDAMKSLARRIHLEPSNIYPTIDPNSVPIANGVTLKEGINISSIGNRTSFKMPGIRINGSGQVLLIVNGRYLTVRIC